VQLGHRGEGGTADHRGQRAGVAVREQPGRRPAQLGDQVGAEPGLGGRAGDLLVAQAQGLGEYGVPAGGQPGGGTGHAAGEVDGGGPGGTDGLDRGGEASGITEGGQRHPERPGHAERGRAADGEPAYRVDQFVHCGQSQDPGHVGQRGLVDDLDRAAHPVDRAHTTG
jgi:hypothetical protein